MGKGGIQDLLLNYFIKLLINFEHLLRKDPHMHWFERWLLRRKQWKHRYHCWWNLYLCLYIKAVKGKCRNAAIRVFHQWLRGWYNTSFFFKKNLWISPNVNNYADSYIVIIIQCILCILRPNFFFYCSIEVLQKK